MGRVRGKEQAEGNLPNLPPAGSILGVDRVRGKEQAAEGHLPNLPPAGTILGMEGEWGPQALRNIPNMDRVPGKACKAEGPLPSEGHLLHQQADILLRGPRRPRAFATMAKGTPAGPWLGYCDRSGG